MSLRLKVFIAGPYTKGDTALNVRAAIAAADALLKLGVAPFVPHLSHLWHLLSPHEYTEWMDLGLAWLPHCDALVRLPGESGGADREENEARHLRIPVFHGVEAFAAYLRGDVGTSRESLKGGAA